MVEGMWKRGRICDWQEVRVLTGGSELLIRENGCWLDT